MLKYKRKCKKYQELIWNIQKIINSKKPDKEKVIVINNLICMFEIEKIFNVDIKKEV